MVRQHIGPHCVYNFTMRRRKRWNVSSLLVIFLLGDKIIQITTRVVMLDLRKVYSYGASISCNAPGVSLNGLRSTFRRRSPVGSSCQCFLFESNVFTVLIKIYCSIHAQGIALLIVPHNIWVLKFSIFEFIQNQCLRRCRCRLCMRLVHDGYLDSHTFFESINILK